MEKEYLEPKSGLEPETCRVRKERFPSTPFVFSLRCSTSFSSFDPFHRPNVRRSMQLGTLALDHIPRRIILSSWLSDRKIWN